MDTMMTAIIHFQLANRLSSLCSAIVDSVIMDVFSEQVEWFPGSNANALSSRIEMYSVVEDEHSSIRSEMRCRSVQGNCCSAHLPIHTTSSRDRTVGSGYRVDGSRLAFRCNTQ